MEKIEFKRRVALFRSELGYASLLSEWAEKNEDYVRISEYVEIELEPLTNKDLIEKQVAVLNRKEKKVIAETERALTDIRRRKAELLALPAPSQE